MRRRLKASATSSSIATKTSLERSDDGPSVEAVMSAFRRAASASTVAAERWLGKFASCAVLWRRWRRLHGKRRDYKSHGQGYSRLERGVPP